MECSRWAKQFYREISREKEKGESKSAGSYNLWWGIYTNLPYQKTTEKTKYIQRQIQWYLTHLFVYF